MSITLLLTGCMTSASFVVDDTTATMTGVINGRTPDRVATLIEDHPEVTTISMLYVPGSMNDESNLEAARLIREAGLSTHVPDDGEIASGGVDFFCAGVTRTAEGGALFGVHSWAAGGGLEGGDLPTDDPQHSLYLDFYNEMGIPSEFYWFTLEAASADSIHWMARDELDDYGLLTD